MSKKSSMKNLSTNSKTQYHQIGNLRGQQSNLPLTNQRVLILTTPIKLKDGTVNMEQRAIPLRVDNSQLMVTAQENKSRLVSSKRNQEPLLPSPSSSVLALPINKLNKQSPTVVKNEVGQVMGKLIPLGKFSNIAPSTLPPGDAVPASTPVAVTAGKSLKQKLSKQNSKWGGYKLMKLDKDVVEASKIASEKLKEVSKLKKTYSEGIEVSDKGETSVTVSKPIVKQIENLNEQLTTARDLKPKKQVHLVLKGFKNMASVGDTGTNIKLIPLENWNNDKKLNFVKTDNNNLINSQPKIVDVRTCAIYEIEESKNIGFDKDKLNSDYKEDFDIDCILEQDPLDIDGLSRENCNKFDRSTSNTGSNSNIDLELVDRFQTTDETDSNCERREFQGLNSSDTSSLMQYEETGGLEMISDLQTENYCPQERDVISTTTKIPDSDGSKIVKELNSVVSCSYKNEQPDCTEIEINDINCADLYKRFQISTDDITFRESTMFSYICNLKKKLLQNYKTRIRRSAAVKEKKECLSLNNLSTIQKRFIKSQIRNPGRGSKKQRFTKTDMSMAKDILRATGPRGYNNLRKLFSLPGTSAVARAMSKT